MLQECWSFSFSIVTSKEPLVHVWPLFYITWVLMQELMSQRTCMCLMMSLKILVGTGVHMHSNQAIPSHWACASCLLHAHKLSLLSTSLLKGPYGMPIFVCNDTVPKVPQWPSQWDLQSLFTLACIKVLETVIKQIWNYTHTSIFN